MRVGYPLMGRIIGALRHDHCKFAGSVGHDSSARFYKGQATGLAGPGSDVGFHGEAGVYFDLRVDSGRDGIGGRCSADRDHPVIDKEFSGGSGGSNLLRIIGAVEGLGDQASGESRGAPSVHGDRRAVDRVGGRAGAYLKREAGRRASGRDVCGADNRGLISAAGD